MALKMKILHICFDLPAMYYQLNKTIKYPIENVKTQ